MPLFMGDIADLRDWQDSASARSESVGAGPEEQRVGTQASFEQLLERELAREQAQGVAARPREPARKPAKQFLRKGARGWWMERPEAKRKMQRHVLESVDTDENNQASHKPKKALDSGARRSRPASSEGTTSPEPVKRDELAAAVQISPVRLSPTRRDTDDAVRRSLSMWRSNNRRTNESIETLGMSGVREDYEARREREADELADFEALEQALAAEKESYQREKQEQKQYDLYEDDGASWLRSSEDAGSLREESQRLLQTASRRSSYSNFDLGGESAMVFEGDHVFRSPMPSREQSGNYRAAGSRQSRPSFAPSDISAVSLNDSEPWGDGGVIDHFAKLPESPIAKRGARSFHLPDESDAVLNGRGSVWAEQEVDERDDGELRDEYNTEPGAVRDGARYGRLDAPVSSLVQQVFGGPRPPDDEQEGDEESAFQASRTQRATRRPGTVKQPTRPATTQRKGKIPCGQDRSKSRDQQQRGDAQPHLPTRARVPAYETSGYLPVSVEQKVAELEEEVKFYKSETLQLQRKKAQYEEELQRIAREKSNIDKYREEQVELIAQEWHRERQKMKQEERMFERQMKLKLSAAGSAASRKDRAEIESLKAQIVALQLEAKKSTSKLKAANEVLRQRVAELEGKNRELTEEIKFLEQDRLTQWQRYEEVVKELESRKLKQALNPRTVKQEDHATTLGDISQIGKSAEELLDTFQPARQSSRQNAASEAKPVKATRASTPTNVREDDYNPGRYRQGNTPVAVSREPSPPVKPAQSTTTRSGDGASQTDAAVDEVVHPGGKREVTYRDGTKRIFFADGNEKEILPNGNVVIRFTNGDRKEYFPHTGVSVYHYHEAQTKLTTYPDKTKVYEFPNQQIEKSYPDGKTEILFADGTKKTILPNGDELSMFTDGTTMLEYKDGLQDVTLANGRRIRYYPDGRKTLVGDSGHEREVHSDEELKELTQES